jgi:hypothetical protein
MKSCGYGLHILNTYPHYTGSLGACFVSGLHVFFFCRIILDYFSNGALNERSVDSNWRVVAAKEYCYFLSFLSSFLPRNYFLYFSFSLVMIG